MDHIPNILNSLCICCLLINKESREGDKCLAKIKELYLSFLSLKENITKKILIISSTLLFYPMITFSSFYFSFIFWDTLCKWL